MRTDNAHEIIEMIQLYNKKAPKKATNLSVNSHLLTIARELDLNLSATFEEALDTAVRKNRREQWLNENKTALENCNTLSDENGLFADKHRNF